MDWKFETDKWPFVKARFFTMNTSRRDVRVIVIHSMEAVEKGDTAEKIARYFQTTARKASAHICVDNNSIVQCVLDNDVAYAAPGANHDGIQIEMAGFARQAKAEWLDPYSTLVLENAASAAAQYCLKYAVPVRKLSDAKLGDKKSRGIVSHAQVTDVFKLSTHTDPGVGFPWAYFIGRVKMHYDKRVLLLGDA